MILPSALFHGLSNYEDIQNYISAQLWDIIADERTHRQLVADPDFAFHLLSNPRKRCDRYHGEISGLVR